MLRKALKYIRWVYTHSNGVRGKIAVNVLLGSVVVALNMAFILVCKHLVDIATGQAEGSLAVFAVWAGVITLVRVAVSAYNSRLSSLLVSRMNFDIRKRLYSNLMQASWLGRHKHHSGDLINRLETDVTIVTNVICSDIPTVFTTMVQVVAAVVVLSAMEWTLAAFLVIVTPLFLLGSKLFFRRMRAMTSGIRESEGLIQSHLQESLRHRTMIRSMENEGRMEDLLDQLQDKEYGQVLEKSNFTVFARVMVMLAFAVGYLAAFLWGVFGVAHTGMTFGVMTSFLQLVGQIQRPVVNLMTQIPGLVSATSSIDRLIELEDIPIEEHGTPVKLEAPVGIRVDNLTYRYPDGSRDIIRNMTYDFPPLSRTAIVGETGSGKSTLIRLMLALLKPVSGTVTLYDSSRETPAAPSTRCHTVYVPQGNSLMSGTIRENLLMGDPSASEERMWKVLHTAAADFVSEYPDGLDTVVGEGGAGLSEGQAQRIAIARGLLRPGSILLLDEFSSSLDPETEAVLMERLDAEAAGKTLIFITHREIISEYCERQCRIRRIEAAS